jgi:peptide/nickel transport system ATP-binding protein/oligopeptide transport system ATP-binding protein
MRKVRGARIGMIFQEPMTSLNPVFTIGDQIAEAVLLHQGVSKKEAWNRAIEMLRRVKIPSPERRVEEYPHQMSGGMRQRVMIAMALSCDPELLIADEPTTALDVTIQAQILQLLRELQRELGMSVLLITHDLGVVAQTAHHVAVMYAGKVVEYSRTRELFKNPRHPYTVGLFQSIPKLGHERRRLDVIPGRVPSALEFPKGCRFNNRCPFATAECATDEPALREIGHPSETHTVACHHWEKVSAEAWHRLSAEKAAQEMPA